MELRGNSGLVECPECGGIEFSLGKSRWNEWHCDGCSFYGELATVIPVDDDGQRQEPLFFMRPIVSDDVAAE